MEVCGGWGVHYHGVQEAVDDFVRAEGLLLVVTDEHVRVCLCIYVRLCVCVCNSVYVLCQVICALYAVIMLSRVFWVLDR